MLKSKAPLSIDVWTKLSTSVPVRDKSVKVCSECDFRRTALNFAFCRLFNMELE